MAKQKDLKAANHDLQRTVAGLRELLLRQQQQSSVALSEKELAHAELAEAAREIDELQDNIQVRWCLRPVL